MDLRSTRVCVGTGEPRPAAFTSEDQAMPAYEQVVLIAEERVLIYSEGENWYWRGADWTGHMGSHGSFTSKESAIENARNYFLPRAPHPSPTQ
jgi:hypothetical protein